MASKKKFRVLPDDVFYTIMLSALAFNGIGSGVFADNIDVDAYHLRLNTGVKKFDWDTREDTVTPVGNPCCAHGHAAFAGNCSGKAKADPYQQNPIEEALDAAGINYETNDSIFAAGETRLSFTQWSKRLNVIPKSEAVARGLKKADIEKRTISEIRDHADELSF